MSLHKYILVFLAVLLTLIQAEAASATWIGNHMQFGHSGHEFDTYESFIVFDTGAGPFRNDGQINLDRIGWTATAPNENYSIASGPTDPTTISWNYDFAGDITRDVHIDFLAWNGGVGGSLGFAAKFTYTAGVFRNVAESFGGPYTFLQDPTGGNGYDRTSGIVPEPPQFLLKWGTYGTGEGQFSSPYMIAVDGSGNVFVSDADNSRIQKFTSNGTFLTQWGTLGSGDGQFYYTLGVAVDDSGNVYVADQNNHRIQKFTSNGTFLTKWGTQGSGDGQFNSPHGVAIDGSGNVYVADHGNSRIQKFTSDGAFLTKWGTPGTGDGQFTLPRGVAVDGSGNVYVADANNGRIQKFTGTGVFITKWGSGPRPDGVAVDGSDNVYVTDVGTDDIQKFTSTGTFLTRWGTQGNGDGQFINPEGVVVDGCGNVYVVDAENSRIQKFGDGVSPVTGLFSPSHAVNTWSNSNVIDVQWNASTDTNIVGYSIMWDTVMDSEPDSIPETSLASISSPALSDGSWNFHIRAVNIEGYRSATRHLGPFKIDTVPPNVGVLAPGIGQILITGHASPIVYQYEPSAVQSLDLFYLRTNVEWVNGQPVDGTVDTIFVASPAFNPADSVGIFNWVPDDTTHKAQILAVAADSAGNVAEDVSQGYFQISPWVTGTPEISRPAFLLAQNTPNPFSGSTTIGYSVENAGDLVRLDVFDIGGRLVRRLLDGPTEGREGSARWDGTDDRGQPVPAGVYFYLLKAGDRVMTRRLVLRD